MDKNNIAKVAIGSMGLLYVGAGLMDQENKDRYEEYVDGASEALSNIPVTFTEEFNLVTESGDNIITADGDQINVSQKVSYEIDLQSRPEVAIVSPVKKL